MKRIFFTALLVLSSLACASLASAQIPWEIPCVEYSNDFREFGTLRRVFVYSANPFLRETMVNELRRERGLLEIVEEPEGAEFYLISYEPMGGGAEGLVAPEGAGQQTVSVALVAFRMVESRNGPRPRLLFITRKSKTVQKSIVLPLTSLDQLGSSSLNQSVLSPRTLSKRGLKTEIGVRGVLFVIDKLFHKNLRFNQLNNTVTLDFGSEPEIQAVREFVRVVKKARKEQSRFAELPELAPNWFGLSLTEETPPPMLNPAPPCQQALPRPAGTTYGDLGVVNPSGASDSPSLLVPAARPRRARPKTRNRPGVS